MQNAGGTKMTTQMPDFCDWWTPERIKMSDDAWLVSKAYIEFAKRIREVMNMYGLKSVIELGCGAGYVGSELKDFTYLGVDGSPAMIAHAKEKNPGVQFEVANMRNLPYSGYDLVCSFGVLKHFSLEDFPEIFKKATAIAKYGLFEMQLTSGKSENNPEDSYNHTWISADDLYGALQSAGQKLLRNVVWINASPGKDLVFIVTKNERF